MHDTEVTVTEYGWAPDRMFEMCEMGPSGCLDEMGLNCWSSQ
jgi:hypothetical protein